MAGLWRREGKRGFGGEGEEERERRGKDCVWVMDRKKHDNEEEHFGL